MTTRAARAEVVAFRAALALAALHAGAAAFLRPQPGTAAADHLASGLVPIAAAVSLALAYPRLRPGARATAALAGGALAATAGVLAGPPSLVAAALLLALGASTLWRSRRRDGPFRRRLARRAGTGAAALAGTWLLLLPVAMAIVGTQKPRVLPAAADLGRPHRDATLTTADGLRLAAWYVPSRNGAAVIAFPNRAQPVPHARLLVRHGYGVLLLDRRGEGESEGDPNRFGWNGAADLDAAIDFLRRRGERVGGLGLSVGGELLLEVADRRPELEAVVSEGAGVRSLREQLHNPDAPAWLRPVSNWTVQTLALAVLSDAGPPPDLAEARPRRALLIRASEPHGGEELNAVYRGERWTAPGGHTSALAAAPAEYERRVVGFFDRAFGLR